MSNPADLIARGEAALLHILRVAQEDRQQDAEALANPDNQLSALDIDKIRADKIRFDRIEAYILHALASLPEAPAARIAALRDHTTFVLTLINAEERSGNI